MWGQLAKYLTANVWTHDFAERLKMRRKSIARADGMPDHEVGTYPQSIVNVKNFGGLRGVLLGGLLTATGAGGALGIASLLGAFQKQPPPVVEKQVWRGKLGIGYSQDGELEVDLDGKPVRVQP